MKKAQKHRLKIIVVGESGVGKTCLILRYADNKFIPDVLSTIGADYRRASLTIGGQPVELQIWDTAGQEKYRTLTESYFRGADAALIVFGVDSDESFNQVSYWIDSIKKKVDEINMVLIGNKSDVEERLITNEAAVNLANENQIRYFETSAKDGTNISEAFEYLSVETYKRITNSNKKESESESVPLENNEKNKSCNC